MKDTSFFVGRLPLSSNNVITKNCLAGCPFSFLQFHRLKSQLDLDQLGRNELELKANLYFHIGNPIKRWKIERVIPVKLLLQLVKTLCLIIQV